MNAKFLVAKYAPDMKRMEPRNIGVILWVNGKTDALFAGEDPDSLVLSGPPKRIGVNDKSVYQQWIASWRLQLAKPVIEIGRGELVRRDSPHFLDAVREWSRGNFMLVEGGQLLEKIDPRKIRDVTAHLFRQLVSETLVNEPREGEQLKAVTARILKTSGVGDRPDCYHDVQEWYKAIGVMRHFTFNFVIGPTGKPYSVYHRVLIRHQKTFESVIGQLNWFKESRKYDRRRICAFVFDAKAESCTEEQQANCKLLEKIATVIDVANEPLARQQLLESASLNGEVKV